MDLKRIKKQPFAKFEEDSKVRWKVTVREPVVDGERLLVVDFLKNEGNTAYRYATETFRIICAKRSETVWLVNEKGKEEKRLEGRLSTIGYDYVLISEKEEARLQRFFGNKVTSNHQLDNLSRWAKETKEKMKVRKQKERGELLDDDYRLCPETLPEGLIEYICREVLPQDKTLIYKKGNVRGTCFQCGRQVRASSKRFTQGAKVLCPDCGAEVWCALEGSNIFSAEYVENIIAVQKGTDGETVFFRQWMLHRDPTAQWENIEAFLKETARYAVRGRKTAKWQKEGKENNFMHYDRYNLPEWTRWGDNRIYDGSYFFYEGGLEEALRGTPMQYADLRGYEEAGKKARRRTDPVHFLQYHAKFPVVEFLWKMGYHHMVFERINGMTKENRNAIRWQRDKLKECFRFPLRLLKLKKAENWRLDDVATLNKLWAARGNALTEKEVAAVFQSNVDIENIRRALPYAGVMKILHYIEKQQTRTELMRATSMTYRDYLQECEQLRLDLRDKEILFPKNLYAAHERTMAQIKFEQNKADQEKFRKVVEALEKFAWETGGFIIRPAREQKELTDEGTALHHCVGGYIQRMAKGETAIFFVRRTEEQDKPFYTLELRNKKVIQCRTENNKSYELSEDVKSFVDMWMERIVLKGGNKKKKKPKEAAA